MSTARDTLQWKQPPEWISLTDEARSEDEMYDREEFLYAIEMARALHDPAMEWDAFRDTLWSFLIRVFGLEDGEDWPDDLPDPIGQVVGDAADVAGWMRERMEPDQSSIPMPRS